MDSGLPDYRGPQGFWKAYPALQARGLSLEDMSHPQWFMQDPHAAWGFYAHRAHLYHSATPHAGFGVLRAITETKKGNYFVFTSNIDSQFQAAGFDEDRIYEAHGTSYLRRSFVDNCFREPFVLAVREHKVPRGLVRWRADSALAGLAHSRAPENDCSSALPALQLTCPTQCEHVWRHELHMERLPLCDAGTALFTFLYFFSHSS